MMPLPDFTPTGDPSRFSFRLEAGHPAFEGHFPGHPILPGVLQVDWAIRQGQAAFGPLGTFTRLTQLKFMRLIQPGEPLTLVLSWQPEHRTLGFAYEGSDGRKASGTVNFQ